MGAGSSGNSGGLDRTAPDPDKSVRLRLLYSPEVVSPRGTLAPKAARESGWVEVPPGTKTAFKAEREKVLAPTEEAKLASVNLRDMFDLGRPGFYRVQLLPARDVGEDGVPATPAEVSFSLAPRSAR
jgi:hypothetical protein